MSCARLFITEKVLVIHGTKKGSEEQNSRRQQVDEAIKQAGTLFFNNVCKCVIFLGTSCTTSMIINK